MHAKFLLLVSIACASHGFRGSRKNGRRHGQASTRQPLHYGDDLVANRRKAFAMNLFAWAVPRPKHSLLAGAAKGSRRYQFRKKRCCMLSNEIGQEEGTVGSELANKFRQKTYANVINTLETDLPEILEKEPSWDIFAENFTMIDQTGAKIYGLELITGLWKSLYDDRFEDLDISKIRIDVRGDGSNGKRPENIVARLRIPFQTSGNLAFVRKLIERERRVDIEAEVVFHLDLNLQIDRMRVDTWIVNGQRFPIKLQLWPNMNVSDKIEINLEKMREWIEDTNVLQTLDSDAADNFRDLVLPNRREIVFQLLGQGLVLFIGKKELDKQIIDVDLTRAVELFVEDVTNILYKEPHWDIFSDNFRVLDKEDRDYRVLVAGLKPIQLFSGVFRDYLSSSSIRDSFKVSTQTGFDDEHEPIVTLRWSLKIDSPQDVDLPTFIKLQNFPLRLSGEFSFFFKDRKVSFMIVDSFVANGEEIDFPVAVNPDVSFSDVEEAVRDWWSTLTGDVKDAWYRVKLNLGARNGSSDAIQSSKPTHGDELDKEVRSLFEFLKSARMTTRDYNPD